MAGIVVWNKVDDVTHGVASFRFQVETASEINLTM